MAFEAELERISREKKEKRKKGEKSQRKLFWLRDLLGGGLSHKEESLKIWRSCLEEDSDTRINTTCIQ